MHPEEAVLLGAPILPNGKLDSMLHDCCADLSRAITRLQSVESHDALILLRSCLSAPKIQHILRCTPCYDHTLLLEFDNLLRQGLCSVTNSILSDTQWLQACLPIRDGGLGIRRAAPLALSSYLASAASTRDLQSSILGTPTTDEDFHFAHLLKAWQSQFNIPLPDADTWARQSTWDKPQFQSDKREIWNAASDNYNISRLSAVAAAHSGDWLHALPISACGLRLSNEAVRVAVGFRLGIDICQPHSCPCGDLVDGKGIHALSCKQSSGRLARHHTVNDIFYRALSKAHIPCVKEPSGLVRTDGKRPDGLTLIPWQQGKCLTWDVSIVNPLASSYVNSTALVPGGVAEFAAERKTSKYSTLSASYLFQPLILESLGAVNSSAITFITDLGRRLQESTGESRETEFLFQRLSIAVQRFNEVAFKGSFDLNDLDDDN